LKRLENDGIAALQAIRIEPSSPYATRVRWKRPVISTRVAKELRKHAIHQGTYGSFENGVGWDPAWDAALSTKQKYGRLQPPKLNKYVRTREERARKIDEAVSTMDQQIEDYYQEKHDAKPVKDFDWLYKKLSSSQR